MIFFPIVDQVLFFDFSTVFQQLFFGPKFKNRKSAGYIFKFNKSSFSFFRLIVTTNPVEIKLMRLGLMNRIVDDSDSKLVDFDR